MSEWRENDAEWYEEQMLFCDLCGRMIAKWFLSTEVEGMAKTFCSEGCEDLYRDYWLNDRGRDYRRPDNVHELYAELMVK